MNFVSISLLVSLEMVKFFQGTFIEKDWMIYDELKDMPAKVQSSNLNEELGMVKYVFSDKTGTLTQNIMEFKKFSAGFKKYGTSQPKTQQYEVSNVNFWDDKFEKDWTLSLQYSNECDNPHLNDFMNILAICHTIIVERKNGKL